MSDQAAITNGPLTGLKVVELGQLIAGPFAAKTLADFGAEVIKIESPSGGDPLRQWRLLHNGTSVWWQVQSRNKKSVTLDLKDEASRAIVRELIREADVLIENFKPGVMEDWGLGYETLSPNNPGLIMLRISGYGETGPYRDIVLLNAAAAFLVGEKVETLREGVELAAAVIDDGRAQAALDKLVSISGR